MPLYELLFSADEELLRLGLHASWIWKLSFRELRVNVLPQACIANGIPVPVKNSIRPTVTEFGLRGMLAARVGPGALILHDREL